MELFLLCLLGILLGPTKIQAQDSLPTITPRSSLSMFPRQPDFQYKELQGKWYVLTSAEAPVFNETDPEGAWQSMTLELNDDNSYNVTIVWYSNSTCLNHYDVALPTGKPGVFTFKNVISESLVREV
ncbi:neutrophil gelatinase-associated lipocalin-like [Cavia porcellus]|uniref:neutrophil gelatinase-associated lipocalin-like n=1 Tax=Cavia porcellus TaxID=10141 RepID=UPI002FE1CC66